MSTSTRVAKNTGFLYLRMGLSILISLYSTRLILSSLGEIDFGIFNVIGGSIAMMGFLNSTLANATQRFMSYEEGKGDIHSKTKIFNISLILHFIIAGITILLLLAIMPLLFNEFLNIPYDRISCAKTVYFFLIISTSLTIINVPYDAVLNAHENMFYYAVVGVFESLLKLGIAFICIYTQYNRLILYSLLMTILPLITLTILNIYCHRHYSECKFALKESWDYNIIKQIAKFSGWNLLTAVSSLFTIQGLSIVLNHFFGTLLNAAQGIANQVNGQLSALSTNMMKALSPVIVKRTANSDIESITKVTYSGSKFSAIIILLFTVPVCFKMEYILSLWLEKVPQWTGLFCQLQLIQTVIIQATNPLAIAIYGNGDIKNYAIWKSIMNTLPIILSIIAFSYSCSPIWLYLLLIIFMGLGGGIVIIYYAKKKCHLSSLLFLRSVVIPLIGISILMIMFGFVFDYFITSQNFLTLIGCCLSTTLGSIISLFLFGLTNEEKSAITLILKSITKRVSGLKD